MSDPNENLNPFSALIKEEGETSAPELNNVIINNENSGIMSTESNVTSCGQSNMNKDVEKVNSLVENIFYITLNKDAKSEDPSYQLIYLEELAETHGSQKLIDLETLEQALFERLLLPEPKNYVVPANPKAYSDRVIQPNVFSYLFTAVQNILSYGNPKDEVSKNALQKMLELVFRNAVTALKQPALFENQDFTQQLLQLLQDVDQDSRQFIIDIVAEFMSDGDPESASQLEATFKPVLQKIERDVHQSNLMNLDMYILPAVHLFASNQYLGPILLRSCEPKNPTNGRAYQETLLGRLIALSSLPHTPTSSYEFFENPMDTTASMLLESSLWNSLRHLTDNVQLIILCLLRAGGESRQQIMAWIGNCIRTNASLGKLWNLQADINPSALTCVSEGFMLNLGAIMFRLCLPFCKRNNESKSLKIDPTYCAVPAEDCEAKLVHLGGLQDETCLLPPRENADGRAMPRPIANSYNFVTEVFYMAHRCVDLGYRVSGERLSRLGQEIGRAQRALADAADQPGIAPALDAMRQRMQRHMTKYMSLRCALMEPNTWSQLSKLNATTAWWLVQVAVHEAPPSPADTYAPLQIIDVTMPVTAEPPDTLRCVPEFLLENVVNFVSLTRRAITAGDTEVIPDAEHAELLGPVLTLVLTFMGSQERMKNPHLRARLAECLEAMLPSHPENNSSMQTFGTYYREMLFKEHPHRLQLVPCLLDVFVAIEMTGQSVQFEQKFNYRRPMYLVMDFLWKIEDHRRCFSRLAREAEKNMEAVHPPIYLRFVNLLMNDAIFLLDEALSNIAQIRTMQTAHESGAWNNLTSSEREQNLSHLAHVGMLARFDNILGRDTTRTLVRLTSDAPYIFCHPTMVDRVASMLNYFLLNLVGPNKKNFKVKDQKEFEFDPASTVKDICRMYVELGNNERFCAAVSDDGRSYSPQLFSLAETVLVRIGGGPLISSLREVAERVAKTAALRQCDEEALAGAPEDFLDPIMSTLMLDPVVLPSSRTTVDRTTIARHLLSDQTDPFNRSPLTMDQVKSNVELKEKIHSWINQRKQMAQSSSSANKESSV